MDTAGTLPTMLRAARQELLQAKRVYTDEHPNVQQLVAEVEALKRELADAPSQPMAEDEIERGGGWSDLGVARPILEEWFGLVSGREAENGGSHAHPGKSGRPASGKDRTIRVGEDCPEFEGRKVCGCPTNPAGQGPS